MIRQDALRPFLTTTLGGTDFAGLGTKYTGKVRDVYTREGRIILVSTDRQSAFDEFWCTIPLKGQVLNQLSNWWFEHVKDVMQTHVTAVPDPNVTVGRRLRMTNIEIVVRAYMTGSTSTSIWVHYQKGSRNFCGNVLPEGLCKNQKLPEILFTPSTKSEESDESISPDEFVKRGLSTPEEIERVRECALALFRRGQEIAAKRGLILVDTKYEMGYDDEGKLCVSDEVHTPDSSRYWIASSYEERFAKGEEPESLDKEFFRLWVKSQGWDYGKPKPKITDDIRLMLAEKYIDLYERVTGETFQVPQDPDVIGRIQRNLKEYWSNGVME